MKLVNVHPRYVLPVKPGQRNLGNAPDPTAHFYPGDRVVGVAAAGGRGGGWLAPSPFLPRFPPMNSSSNLRLLP